MRQHNRLLISGAAGLWMAFAGVLFGANPIVDGGFETASLNLAILPVPYAQPQYQNTDGWTACAATTPGDTSSIPGSSGNTSISIGHDNPVEGVQFASLQSSTVTYSGTAGSPVNVDGYYYGQASLWTTQSFYASAGDILSFDYRGGVVVPPPPDLSGAIVVGYGRSDASLNFSVTSSSGTTTSVCVPAGAWTCVSQVLPISDWYTLEFTAYSGAQSCKYYNPPPYGTGMPRWGSRSASAWMDIDDVRVVPEPSTIALLLTASLGGLLWWRRRR
jgi:hypothetical protein